MKAATGSAHLRAEVKARGFAPSTRLRRNLRREMRRFAAQFPDLDGGLQVRLFHVPADPASAGYGCLVHATLGPAGRAVIASGIDAAPERAMREAFARLSLATLSALRPPGRAGRGLAVLADAEEPEAMGALPADSGADILGQSPWLRTRRDRDGHGR